MAPKTNPLDNFVVNKKDIDFIGENLQRPECILAERDGTLWVADARGGVVKIGADRSQTLITQKMDSHFEQAADIAQRFTQGTLPNGLAFAANGDILIADFGTDALEVMTRDGQTRTLYDRIEGEPIGKVNFVLRDRRNRLWLTISTRIKNWMEAVGPNTADGYIALVDERGIRIVADGFQFTNEVRLDREEKHLYIAETTGRHVSRMRVTPEGNLKDREIFGPTDLGPGGFPDGIAFDAFGNLWGTLVFGEKIFALTPQGDLRIILDDGNPEAIARLDANFFAGTLTPEDMINCRSAIAPWMASVTFGGPDLATVHIGTLMGTTIPSFRSPVAGLPMVHW